MQSKYHIFLFVFYLKFKKNISNHKRYVVAFDPLDGSSNIEANVTIGTIFAIWRRKSDTGSEADENDLLQSGKDIICGGYCVYGPST
jgi:fructose-1,6-bisphosphatase I